MSVICPKCGVEIHNEKNPTCYNCLRIENESRRYRRTRSTGVPYRQKKNHSTAQNSLKSKPPHPTQRYPNENRHRLNQNAPSSQLAKNPQRHLQRQAINKLLRDIYKSPKLLSNILESGGMRPAQIQQIKSEHMPEFLDEFVPALLAWWKQILTWQQKQVICFTYKIEGYDKTDKRTLMQTVKMSSKQIDECRKSAIQLLHFPSRRQELEKIIIDKADRVLKIKYKS